MPTAFIHPRTMYHDGNGNSFSDPKEAADSVKSYEAMTAMQRLMRNKDAWPIGAVDQASMADFLRENWKELRAILNNAEELDVQIAKG